MLSIVSTDTFTQESYTAWFDLRSSNCSKRLSVSLFQRAVQISAPDKNKHSTGVDDGTVAFSCHEHLGLGE